MCDASGLDKAAQCMWVHAEFAFVDTHHSQGFSANKLIDALHVHLKQFGDLRCCEELLQIRLWLTVGHCPEGTRAGQFWKPTSHYGLSYLLDGHSKCVQKSVC